MKYFMVVLFIVGMVCPAFSQELYVNTEPASNMATHSLGIRLENQGYFNPGFKNRSTLELMYGESKSVMLHGSLYLSNYYQDKQRLEGGSVYAKFRFLSIDSVQKHFRGAFFAKLSSINNPVINQDITLEGDNSGLQTGVVFTQLLHKLALSGSASYLRAFNNCGRYDVPLHNSKDALGYTLSGGYLTLPKTYTSYSQTNMNLYLELLGKINPGYGQSYLDAAPSIQFIFNSLIRVDFSYRVPLYNTMERNTKNMYLIRLEYNIFNL